MGAVMMICFHLLPPASFTVTLHIAKSTALEKEPDRIASILAVSSHVGPGPVWTKLLVKPSVLCQIESLLFLPKIQEECVKGPSLEYRPYVPK